MKVSDIRNKITSMANDSHAEILQRFFKTGPGEYGEGDIFLGVRSPQTRNVVREAFKASPTLPYHDIERLLQDPYHEVRFAGFLYLVERYQRIVKKKTEGGDELIHFYLSHAHLGNNWDLVDCICPRLSGTWLCLDTVSEEEKWRVMQQLAGSSCLWHQRISMVSTWMTLRHHRPDFTLSMAETHLHHPHPLMHKAVGWMLREMGSRVDIELLRAFLSQHATEMPRTMLRYAIEKMSREERLMWMKV